MISIIETMSLTKIFSNKLIAVNNLNLKVEEGAIYGLLGPNGAGKTTVIRQLLSLIRPTSGVVKVFDEDMTPNSSNLRGRIGYLSTNPKYPPKMTPITYLNFVGKLFCLSKSVRTSRLSSLIRSVDLLHSASQEIKGFSTGMVTRLGLAAAMMNHPDLLILDEPTSGLDPVGRKSTLDLLEQLESEKTILISSHILTDIERICTHVGIINEGKLIYSGTIKEMKKHIQSNRFRLELDGNIDTFCDRLASIEGIVDYKKMGEFAVEIRFVSGSSVLKMALAVLNLIVECNLELISLNSAVSSIEEAFLELIEEEESLGFTRAFRD
ncbi:MAG: ABC transporter ATP-binding protein [Candidatus Thorarchaeota archaeon]